MAKQTENTPEKKKRERRLPTFLEAISILVVLIILFGIGALFDLQSAPLMALAAIYTGIIAWRCGMNWDEMEEVISKKIHKGAPAMTILLVVGFLIASWMFSGTIPFFIYYGVRLISEQYIYVSAFVLTSIFSLVTGTSMGSAGTAGLATIGIALAMPNVNMAAVAGASYAGSIFGDKLSPLSDTTIIASLVTDNDIFDHIKHLAKTVIPAAVVGLVIYFVMGLKIETTSVGLPPNTLEMLDTLGVMFKFGIIVIAPILVVVWGAVTKRPSAIVMLASTILALLIGVFYQGFTLNNGINVLYSGFNSNIVETARTGFSAATMNADARLLLERGGLSSMLKPFILVYLCFYFSALIEESGSLQVVFSKLLAAAKTPFSLIFATAVTTILMVVVGGSSTVALLVTGEMFKTKYEEMGLSTLNLSRTLEDFGTGLSAFLPWTSSGVYYPVIYGVGNLAFFRYSFLSYVTWGFSMFYAASGITIIKSKAKTAPAVEAGK